MLALVLALQQQSQVSFARRSARWFPTTLRTICVSISSLARAPRCFAATAFTLLAVVLPSGCKSPSGHAARGTALEPSPRGAEPDPGEMNLAAAAPDALSQLHGKHTFAGYPHQHRSGDALQFTVYENIGYAIGYSEVRKDPLWACYLCKWKQGAEAPGPRPSKFKVDTRTAAKVTHESYKQADYNTNPKSYDRGHMAPNFAIGSRYGRDAQLETFLMSNVCPQRSTLNQQPWEALEKRIATDLSEECGEVWVTVGLIFEGTPARLNSVAAIPSAFFAIIVDDDAGHPRVLALKFSQEDQGSSHTLRDHWTTVDDVEESTGLDFLTDLPDAVEDAIERTGPDEDWDLDRPLVPTPHNN